MIDYLFKNATVITPLNGAIAVLPGHDILVQGNRIEAVQLTGQVDIGQVRELIDASQMIAMPGLINAHCHIAMVLFRGAGEDIEFTRWFNEVIWPLEANETPEDVYWGTLLGLAELIEAGVTTVADHYFSMDEVARAVEQAGIRANLVWAMFSQGSDAPELKLRETSQFVERWQNGAQSRITTWLGPHAPYTCDNDFLRACAQQSKKLGVGLHIHASETRREVQASLVQKGRTPIGILQDTGVLDGPALVAHAAHATDDDIAILAKAGAGVAHCPKTFLKLAAGIAPVLKMRAAGVPVGIGSDGVVSNNTLDILEQTRLAAMLQKHENQNAEVLTIDDALTMVFEDGARVLRLDGPRGIGALVPGQLADLILVRTDVPHMQPLINVKANILYSAQAADVDTVMCNGKLLMRERRLLTLDKQLIIAEINARQERLLQRSGQRIQTYRA